MDDEQLNHLLQRAQKYMDQKKYEQASDLYEEAYQQKPEFTIQKKLVIALHLCKQDDIAWDLVKNDLSKYLTNAADIKLVMDIMMDLYDFIGAQQLLINCDQLTDSERQKLQGILEYNQFTTRIRRQELHSELKKSIPSLVMMPLDQQSQIVVHLHEFSMEDFLKNAKLLLANPYLHPLIKAGVADDVVKLRVKEEILISFYGESKTFVPNDYPTIVNLECLRFWQESLLNNKQLADTVHLDVVLAEVNLYAALLYPFTDQVVDDPDLWLQTILQRLNLENTAQLLEKDSKAVRVDNWLNKFEELLSLFN